MPVTLCVHAISSCCACVRLRVLRQLAARQQVRARIQAYTRMSQAARPASRMHGCDVRACGGTARTMSPSVVAGPANSHRSINQSAFVYYGMTKCKPTTRSKKAIQLVRKKACLDDKSKNLYVICVLYNMRVRKLESDNCVECSGNCRECARCLRL